MMPMMKAGLHVVWRALLASAGVLACMALGAASTRAQDTTSVRFEISFPATAHGEAVTGRVYVMLSRGNDREPRFQIGRTGVPFFGRDIDALAPGQVAIIDDTDLGSPLPSVRDIPPGDYYVQGFVNIYSAFPRADGHVVWMHDDRWEGQQWPRSPGNLYSTAQRVRIDPGLAASSGSAPSTSSHRLRFRPTPSGSSASGSRARCSPDSGAAPCTSARRSCYRGTTKTRRSTIR